LNYRHAFHAGNFADLVKHACLTSILDALIGDPQPFTVVDTHAGAGAYDLTETMSKKTGEAAIERLAADPDAPEAFDPLLAAVRRINPDGGFRLYPGSPTLIAAALRDDDRLVACELHPEDGAALAELMAPMAGQVRVARADGYVEAERTLAERGRLLLHIDPPFERSDDYVRTAGLAVAAAGRGATVAIWVPLKDLETFDGFLRRLEDADAPILVAEVRLFPLDNPMRLNGCAMIVANPSLGLEADMREICAWTASRLGGPGNEARVWRL